jgi:hypothetical protein
VETGQKQEAQETRSAVPCEQGYSGRGRAPDAESVPDFSDKTASPSSSLAGPCALTVNTSLCSTLTNADASAACDGDWSDPSLSPMPRAARVLSHKNIGHEELSAEDYLVEQLAQVPSTSLEQLPSIVDLARVPELVHRQLDVLAVCLKRILHTQNPLRVREPRAEQVRVLRRLIYMRADALLIAKTGFGKSIIYQAYSIATGLTTIQIIPLIKLGEEQTIDVEALKGTRPCLATAATKHENRKLFDEIENGDYTHILLGPEQAASKEFREAVKHPKMQDQVGLVVIDEVHLIEQWGERFREQFQMIGLLREVVSPRTVWFGCSATVDDETEQVILIQSTSICYLRAPLVNLDRPYVLCRQLISVNKPESLLEHVLRARLPAAPSHLFWS